ncbi:MAG: hypothetical protein AAF802_22655 [Planctomycetota bacterium]
MKRSGKAVPIVVAALCVVMCGVSFMRMKSSGTEDATDAGLLDDAANVSQASFVLEEIPGGEILTPTDVKELEGESVSAVIAGKIDGGDIDPFQPGKIAFLISQLPDEAHSGGDPDHVDNCPFCKRKLENAPKALVEFKGVDGATLDGDAASVLGVKAGDTVVVTGTAVYDSVVNTVLVEATGVHVKSRS